MNSLMFAGVLSPSSSFEISTRSRYSLHMRQNHSTHLGPGVTCNSVKRLAPFEVNLTLRSRATFLDWLRLTSPPLPSPLPVLACLAFDALLVFSTLEVYSLLSLLLSIFFSSWSTDSFILASLTLAFNPPNSLGYDERDIIPEIQFDRFILC